MKKKKVLTEAQVQLIVDLCIDVKLDVQQKLNSPTISASEQTKAIELGDKADKVLAAMFESPQSFDIASLAPILREGSFMLARIIIDIARGGAEV